MAGHAERVLVAYRLRLSAPLRLMLLSLADDPVYGDLEVQWVRDEHGAEGAVIIAVKSDTATVDVLVQSHLSLTRRDYEVAAGVDSFSRVPFSTARFEVTPQGAQVALGVVLPDGRPLRLDVTEARPRPRPVVRMLAPAGQSMTDPRFFPFFWMDDIWFLRWQGATVEVSVGGRRARVVRLGAPWRLVRYATYPLTALFCERHDGALLEVPDAPGDHELYGCTAHVADGPRLMGLSVQRDARRLEVTFDPGVPDLRSATHQPTSGRLGFWADHRRQLAGSYWLRRTHSGIDLGISIDQPWDVGEQPRAAGLAFRALPVFRTWPTTFAWTGRVDLDGPEPILRSRWRRVDPV